MLPAQTLIPFYRDPDEPIQPDQYAAEFDALLTIYRARRPMRVLEIGTREGGTLLQWIKHAQPGTVIVSVDDPRKKWGAPDDVVINRDIWGSRAQEYGVDLYSIIGDSHDTIVGAMANLHGPFDFVFIDGDHSMDGVRMDYLFYGENVNPGGIVAFHDIYPDGTDTTIEVYKYWAQVKHSKRSAELFSVPNQKSRGIGVLYV